jgi:GNAT superfamily N-acetyltransferase
MTLQIVPFSKHHIPQAAAMFAQAYTSLRAAVPAAPEPMQDPLRAASKLEWLLERSNGLAALEDGKFASYLSWLLVDDFRDTGVLAAYCPEWSHAALPTHARQVYRALYREAARQWEAAGCITHALTLLAHEPVVIDTWFWNGFGLGTVDAVRPISGYSAPVPDGFSLRRAELVDAEEVSRIDSEHCRHYAEPPVLMVEPSTSSPDEVREFIQQPNSSFWLAWEGDQLAALLKFEQRSFGAASIVAAQDAIAITGAFTRPQVRGRGLLPALLSAGLNHYAGLGFQCCSVDFEAFNPEAAHFWLKYFQPVAYSLLRVPETGLRAVTVPAVQKSQSQTPATRQ